MPVPLAYCRIDWVIVRTGIDGKVHGAEGQDSQRNGASPRGGLIRHKMRDNLFGKT
jgi:hypothetical protein